MRLKTRPNDPNTLRNFVPTHALPSRISWFFRHQNRFLPSSCPLVPHHSAFRPLLPLKRRHQGQPTGALGVCGRYRSATCVLCLGQSTDTPDGFVPRTPSPVSIPRVLLRFRSGRAVAGESGCVCVDRGPSFNTQRDFVPTHAIRPGCCRGVTGRSLAGAAPSTGMPCLALPCLGRPVPVPKASKLGGTQAFASPLVMHHLVLVPSQALIPPYNRLRRKNPSDMSRYQRGWGIIMFLSHFL